MCYVYELLQESFSISAFFYNPNIMPSGEYGKRLFELESFSKTKGFPLLTTDSDLSDRRAWVKKVSSFKELGERSERCRQYNIFRLEETFRKAAEKNFTIVATTLSISPHKNAQWINDAGADLSRKYGISFLEADFKKKDGFKKSVHMSRDYGFYRQDYCGCVYSRLEKDPDSNWSRTVKKKKAEASREPAYKTEDHLELGNELDLHHFNPSDTESLVREFLIISLQKQYSSVRIVHGKGRSRLKLRVHNVLKTHPCVVSFSDDSYNWGATIVQLNTEA